MELFVREKSIPEKDVKGFALHATFQYTNNVNLLVNIQRIQKYFEDFWRQGGKDDIWGSIFFFRYQEAVSNIPVQRADVKKYYKKSKIDLNNKVDALHEKWKWTPLSRNCIQKFITCMLSHICFRRLCNKLVNREIKQMFRNLKKVL